MLFSGLGQLPVDIEHGGSYYTTLRAITNGGNILQATTDGFIVDTTAPIVKIERQELI